MYITSTNWISCSINFYSVTEDESHCLHNVLNDDLQPHAEAGTHQTNKLKLSEPSDQYLTSARSRGRRGTGVWGPSLSGAQRVARGGTCPAWHRWVSDLDQRPHRAPDLKRKR